jgi:hypothetical protein
VLACKESTSSCENRTGVSLEAVSILAIWVWGISDHLFQTWDAGAEAGFDEPEPMFEMSEELQWLGSAF